MKPAAAHSLPVVADQKRRAFWLKHLHQWHWISSGICLVAMLVFAATGLTLNHAAQIEAKPQVTHRKATLPESLLAPLRQQAEAADAKGGSKAALPPAVRDWVGRELAVTVDQQSADWSADEVYVALPRPGGDAWVRVALETARSSMRRPTVAGFPISMTCTRAAIRARPGAGSSMCLRWLAWCSASPACSCCRCMPASARLPGRWWRWGW